jgi:effector-binding domain-containing protein
MDRMIGGDFDKGLVSLKKLAETMPKADFGDVEVTPGSVQPVTVAYFASRCANDNQEIAKAVGAGYVKVIAFMDAHKLAGIGPPITINTKWDDTGYEFEAAIPVDHAPDKPVPADSPVQVKQTYGGHVLRAVAKGARTGMPEAYAKLASYMAARGYESAGSPWDEYVSDPKATPAPDLTTHIYQPIK